MNKEENSPISYHFLSCVDSTHKRAIDRLKETPLTNQWVCLYADQQTEGIGRGSKSWYSPAEGNIYASVLFSLPLTLSPISLSHLIALAIAASCQKKGLSPQIKWPNDLFLSKKKCAGILVHVEKDDTYWRVVASFGFNINMDQKQAQKIDQPATSLYLETGKKWDQNHILEEILEKLQEYLGIYKRSGFAPFVSTYNALLAYKGKKVCITNEGQTVEGELLYCSDEGALCIKKENAEIVKIYSGELTVIEQV